MPGGGLTVTETLSDVRFGALAVSVVVQGSVALPPYEAQAQGASPAARERGAAVYARACARCHGPDGQGAPTGGSIVDPSYLALVSDFFLT